MGGFLDHATNNIIVDAVLTDVGRKFLAQNDGSFSIVKFAFGDDEVDYTMIKKYGRIIGKEKVEKNTPVQEALTASSLGVKYKLISLSNPMILRRPTISLTVSEGTDEIVSIFTTKNPGNSDVTIQQSIEGGGSVPTDLRDSIFEVTLNNQLLSIPNSAPDSIDNQGKAVYRLTTTGQTASGGSLLRFNVAAKALTDTQFTILGTTSDKNIIRSFVKVTGLNSGQVKEFEVKISKV